MKFEDFVACTIKQSEDALEHYQHSDECYEFITDVLEDCLRCIRELTNKGLLEQLINNERRIAKLEEDKKLRDVRDSVMNLFNNMQYSKLCKDPERTEYYKLKLNEIFGSGVYQDTDKPFAPNPITHKNSSVRKCCPDESWVEDARRRGENV